jgi:outer membrane protein W
MKFKGLYIALFLMVLANISFAQTPAGTVKTSNPKDTAMIFQSPRPLMEDNTASNMLNNSAGFSGFVNDFGFGMGLYYRRNLSADLSALATFDFGGAKGPKEFGFSDEIKINRIYVMPLFASLQYRLLSGVLSEGLRPYVTAGAGPALVATTDASQDFFTALVHPKFSSTFGGFVGFGANFGTDPKTTFGASLKYYIIPYRSPGIESTQGLFLTDFSGAALTITYGFNF